MIMSKLSFDWWTPLKPDTKRNKIYNNLKGIKKLYILLYCKVGLEISCGGLVSSVCHEHHDDHPNNLQIECNAFCVSGHVIRFLLWEEGSGNKDLRVVVQWNFLFQVFVRWLPLLGEVLRSRG